MPEPKSRAGSRVRRYKDRVGFGRLSKSKVAWVATQNTHQVAIHEYDPAEWDEENEITVESEQGPTYLLMIPVPGRRNPLIWNMSAMTHEEITALRSFFNFLFDLADPVTRERDKVAKDAAAKGDYSFSRIYRLVPQFVVRERPQRIDGEGVHDGSEGSSERAGDGRDSSRGVRGLRDELADGEPEQGVGQDDEPQADDTQAV